MWVYFERKEETCSTQRIIWTGTSQLGDYEEYLRWFGHVDTDWVECYMMVEIDVTRHT